MFIRQTKPRIVGIIKDAVDCRFHWRLHERVGIEIKINTINCKVLLQSTYLVNALNDMYYTLVRTFDYK